MQLIVCSLFIYAGMHASDVPDLGYDITRTMTRSEPVTADNVVKLHKQEMDALLHRQQTRQQKLQEAHQKEKQTVFEPNLVSLDLPSFAFRTHSNESFKNWGEVHKGQLRELNQHEHMERQHLLEKHHADVQRLELEQHVQEELIAMAEQLAGKGASKRWFNKVKRKIQKVVRSIRSGKATEQDVSTQIDVLLADMKKAPISVRQRLVKLLDHIKESSAKLVGYETEKQRQEQQKREIEFLNSQAEAWYV